MTDWLTPNEAAAYIRARNARTIKDAIKSGHLAAYFYGTGTRDVRIDREDLDQWIKSRPWEPGSS
jgi:excisionase family DNA binding protein